MQEPLLCRRTPPDHAPPPRGKSLPFESAELRILDLRMFMRESA